MIAHKNLDEVRASGSIEDLPENYEKMHKIMTQRFTVDDDQIELSVKCPELKVFRCSEKRGIKKIKLYLIDQSSFTQAKVS